VEMVRSGAYGGVELDYREVDATRKAEFVELVQALAEELHADGRGITLLLPRPVREGAEWDTGGYDWERLGATVDAIKLAQETDESLYHGRMEEVLEFLAQRVDRGKLLLVVGPLSREKGGEGIRSLTLIEALALASQPGLRAEGEIVPGQTVRVVGENLLEEEGASGLHWDEQALAVTFSYPGRGGKRTVWIGNVFSVAFKLDLARRYGLGGVAIEDVSLASGQADIWPAIQEYADAGSVSLVRPNGDLLTPHWVAGAGTFDTETGSTVQWQAPPEPGIYEVTLVVSDGVVRVGQQLAMEVLAPAGEASP
jgi:spore germination protein YaaH